MESTKGMNLPLIASLVLVCIIAAALSYFFYRQKSIQSEIPVIDTGPNVGAEVSGAIESPAEKLPETNPFKNYKNPFE